MSDFIAALPMYDWPEAHAEVDAEWAVLRGRLREAGIDAPETLARRNADMPAVPGGIRDGDGSLVAPDPATLDPDGFDLATLWRHPQLLIAQTCWGPMEKTGLDALVSVVHQPDYSRFEGGEGLFYSSALLMRAEASAQASKLDELVPLLPSLRLAYNEPHSMSGYLALARDLDALGASIDSFAGKVETGSHRGSIRAVAEGHADICAIDCRTLDLARRHEPAIAGLTVVGWTAKRPGLPLISAPSIAAAVRTALG